MKRKNRIFRLLVQLALFLPTLLIATGGCAIGLATGGLRGNAWLVMWAGLFLLGSFWWLVPNLIYFPGGSISSSSPFWETYQEITAWESIPQAMLTMTWAALA